jgi:hypothetical protein
MGEGMEMEMEGRTKNQEEGEDQAMLIHRVSYLLRIIQGTK